MTARVSTEIHAQVRTVAELLAQRQELLADEAWRNRETGDVDGIEAAAIEADMCRDRARRIREANGLAN